MWKPSFALVRKFGANKIVAAVYRHGSPPSLYALAALLKEDHEQQKWQSYMADICCAIAKRLSPKSPFPFWSDLEKKKSAKDSRSGREIVDDLIAKRRRKKLRGGKK